MRVDPLTRFREKYVTDAESGCWLWQRSRIPGGYGMFWFNGANRLAHRVAYELLRGQIPSGLTIDHLCRVRNCVNPDHMELVTMRENTLRGLGPTSLNARKTKCKNGHDYSEDNTYITTQGWRSCRECHKMWDRARRAQLA